MTIHYIFIIWQYSIYNYFIHCVRHHVINLKCILLCNTSQKITKKKLNIFCSIKAHQHNALLMSKSFLYKNSLSTIYRDFYIVFFLSNVTKCTLSVLSTMFHHHSRIQWSQDCLHCSQNDIIPPFPVKLSFAEDGLMAETSLKIKSFTRNWLIIYPSYVIMNFHYIDEKKFISFL